MQNNLVNHQAVIIMIPQPCPEYPNDFPNVHINTPTEVTRAVIQIWNGKELIETFFHNAYRFFPKKIRFGGAVYLPTAHESHDYQIVA